MNFKTNTDDYNFITKTYLTPCEHHFSGRINKKMLKKITVNELKIGMYIVDIGLSWIDYPLLYSKEGIIRSEKEIQNINNDGYKDVFIDIDRSSKKD